MKRLLVAALFLQTLVTFAQGELRIADQSKLPDYARIDIQSLNQLNLDAAQMSPQQRKESFKLFIVSTPFRANLKKEDIVFIYGKLDRELLKSIAEMMIEEMETIDRVAPFSISSFMQKQPQLDVTTTWNCIWSDTAWGEPNGSAAYIQECARGLIDFAKMNEQQAIQLVTSMTTVFKTIHLFNRMTYQAPLLGEDESEVYSRLWKAKDRFFRKYVGNLNLSRFEYDYDVGTTSMGAIDPVRQANYHQHLKELKTLVNRGDERFAEIYREMFKKSYLYVPPELREKK